MPIVILIIWGLCFLWPVICWLSYHLVGWKKWEKSFARKQSNFNTDLASSVTLTKFGSYNLSVSVGIDDFGIMFVPSRILFFHHTFCLPWSNIITYEFFIGHSRTQCILNTNKGQIIIRGDIAEIVARGCQNHFVSQKT